MMNVLKRQFDNILEEHILPRYQQCESREQKLIIAAVILLPLFILIFGFMLPLQDQRLVFQKELSMAKLQAREADQIATYLKVHATDPSTSKSTESLLSSVERMARQSNVRGFITRIKPQTSLQDGQQSLMLRIKDVPYDSLLRFIHILTNQGLGLKSLKIQTSKTPGTVQVHAIIST